MIKRIRKYWHDVFLWGDEDTPSTALEIGRWTIVIFGLSLIMGFFVAVTLTIIEAFQYEWWVGVMGIFIVGMIPVAIAALTYKGDG